jgi:hypothetical protein
LEALQATVEVLMMSRAVLFFPLLGLGCIPSIMGEWDGVCEVETTAGSLSIPFEMDIDEERQDGTLLGDGWYDYEGYRFKGKLSGDRDHRSGNVDMRLVGEYGGYTVTLEVDVDLNGNADEADGDCIFDGAEGDVELEL